LAAIEIVRLYGLRFKIEHTFKQAVRLIGAFTCPFWMSDILAFRAKEAEREAAMAEFSELTDEMASRHGF